MPVFINELHYDNAGADIDEGVELAGTNLQGWRLWFYNGSSGQSYASLALNGVFTNQQNGYGVLGFAFAGIQNGAPDGVALVDGVNQLQQFISYEGVFTGLGGVADNLLSEDIGVVESGATAIGSSLQLTGSGRASDDFPWGVTVSSFGSANALQEFNSQKVSQGTVANAPVWTFLIFGLACLRLRRGKQEVVITV